VLIRPALPAELDTVGRLTVEAYTADGHLSGSDGYAAELRDAARRAELATLLVAVDGAAPEPLGTVTFALAGTAYAEISAPGEAEFRMLAVAPAARGRGVGAALVQACVDRAVATGSTALALCSMASMTPAHRIYGRFGFVRAPDRDWEPEPGIRLVAYLLTL
jgi:GNAT superfamily N-acetyltransferase